MNLFNEDGKVLCVECQPESFPDGSPNSRKRIMSERGRVMTKATKENVTASLPHFIWVSDILGTDGENPEYGNHPKEMFS